jgi:hypothetical protein
LVPATKDEAFTSIDQSASMASDIACQANGKKPKGNYVILDLQVDFTGCTPDAPS